jgi:hypothetical protein
MMPIVIPVVILALGDYLLFAQLRLLGGWVPIAIAHGVLATPYVFILAQTSLTSELDLALVRSARSLGARGSSGKAHDTIVGYRNDVQDAASPSRFRLPLSTKRTERRARRGSLAAIAS